MDRFDLTDAEWAVIEPVLPTDTRSVERVDDRRVLNVFGPVIWWSGFDLKRPGSVDHALQMASEGVSPRRVWRRRAKL